MQQARFWLWPTRSKYNSSNTSSSSSTSSILPLPLESWEEKAFAADAAGRLGGCVWPPRSYSCCFCRREFRSAQALGGHMNVHRRDRARLRQLSGGLAGEAGEEAKHASSCLPLTGIEACQPNPNSCAAAVPPLAPRTSLPVAMHSLHRCAGPELRLGRPSCDEFGSWRWSSDLRSLYEDSSSGSGCSKRRRTGHAILPVGELDLELRLASGPKI